MPPCLTLSIIWQWSRVKWSNPWKGVAPSLIYRCSSYWKGSLRVTLDYDHQLYNNTYIYIYICVCVCGMKLLNMFEESISWETLKYILFFYKNYLYIFICGLSTCRQKYPMLHLHWRVRKILMFKGYEFLCLFFDKWNIR